ncbi:TRAP transporter substrate-binding protein [Puniceibacterium sp. IMCC21224]|uniref:TRAP transporter substrate-binding protein n=1 Tax=Puniceibacterium sp. IMCC21224 TaxID=1618204 RepID=UPI00064D9323|nr:TRAP transporter substrate-binding protein [Puniceibacterium sp. IMCC21224]KMK67034.1 TRAP-type C4-dicarboxylate transport system, periplasmic component [Puniceibacterium sp. IMCC21224]
MKHHLLTAAVAAVTLGLSVSAGIAQEVTLRCQHFLPAVGSVPKFFMEPWAEKIEAESNGRIKVELYPSMQLGGKPPALYDQIRDGVIDCGWVLPAYTPGRFPESEAFELPFMTPVNSTDASKALWEFTEKYMSERFGDIHLIAVHTHGPGVIHKKGEPVTKLEDFAGLSLRGPSRQANKLLETLGAIPIGMPVPAFPEALSKGVVDGGVIPWEVVPGLKVHELAEAHTEIPGDRSLYNTFFLWGMNKAKYESLPDDLKAVIDANSGLETSGLAGAAMDKGDDLAKTMIGERGNKIVSLDPALVDKLREIGAAQTEEWIAEVTALGLDGAAMVADAQALVAKYDTGGL